MKKTLWQPVVLGVVIGLLAGMSMVTNLLLLTTGITNNAIGFFFALMLLAAALGGPVAGVISSTLFVTISYFWGPPDIQAVLSDPVVFWSNLLVLAAELALIGLLYRPIFERLRLPARLLPWVGIIVVHYLVNPPVMIGLQFYLNDEAGFLEAVQITYGDYFPQAIFDIIITSLVFIALPASFTRPLWYTSKPELGQHQPTDGDMARSQK